MKKFTLSILFLTLSLGITAQEKEKRQEIGIAFSSLNSFTLVYKTGTKDALWRYNILIGDFSSSDIINTPSNNTDNSKSINLGFSIGKEFRKGLTEKLTYRYGWDVGISYNSVTTDFFDGVNTSNRKNTLFSPSINAVLGVNYSLNKSFLFGIEILPSLSYTTGNQKTNTNNWKIESWNVGLSNNNARLTLAYIF